MSTSTVPSGTAQDPSSTLGVPGLARTLAPGEAARTLAGLPSAPMLAMFERLAARWGLTRAEKLALLGVRSATTLRRWLADPERANLDLVTRERIAHAFAIHAACVRLFGSGEAADGWVRRANTGPLFDGAAPIERMTAGLTGDLAEVRLYLETEASR